MKKHILIALFALATLVACNNGNSSTQHNDADEHGEHDEHGEEGVVTLSEKQLDALHLTVGPVQMRNLTTVVKVNGQLEVAPAKKADVTAIVGGNVKEIKVFTGDKIKKGQVLAVLEHPDFIKLQEDFSVIANNQEFLEQEYNRQKELYENNVGSGKDFQKAKTEYNISKAKYQGLKSRLQLLNLSPEAVKNGQISSTINIVSPIAGYVNDVNIKLGTYVDAENIMFEIANNSAIHADFMVYEKDVHLLQLGQKIHFTVSNRISDEFTATVFAIGKKFDPNSRAINIHAKIDQSVAGLIPGMYISGHLHTDKNYTKALPNDAIVKEGAKSFVFIVENEEHDEHAEHNENEKHEEHAGHDSHAAGEDAGHKTHFKMVEVITGKTDEGYTEVSFVDDLPENTQVVLSAAYYLLADMGKEETEHSH